jgi:hypothetical protein
MKKLFKSKATLITLAAMTAFYGLFVFYTNINIGI